VSFAAQVWKDAPVARMRASSAQRQSPPPMARHRTLCIVAATVACSLVPAATASACAGSRSRPSQASLDRAVRATVCLINEARGDHGLGALRPTDALAKAASAHSRDMVRNDFFAHDSPTGSTPKERIDRAGYFDGASSWAMGETIAWGSGGRATPSSIVRSWLSSPGHRAILLDGRYKDLGVGIALGAPGRDGGATFTGDFGARG
jgi:uncharacterized protein YkwD